MITAFEKGKYYVWDCKDERIENNPKDILFNEKMIMWFDRKPRKCYRVFGGTIASFDNLVDHDMWLYTRAMKYFKECILVIQEEMDV